MVERVDAGHQVEGRRGEGERVRVGGEQRGRRRDGGADALSTAWRRLEPACRASDRRRAPGARRTPAASGRCRSRPRARVAPAVARVARRKRGRDARQAAVAEAAVVVGRHPVVLDASRHRRSLELQLGYSIDVRPARRDSVSRRGDAERRLRRRLRPSAAAAAELSPKSIELVDHRCVGELAEDDLTLFANGTVRLRERVGERESMLLAELERVGARRLRRSTARRRSLGGGVAAIGDHRRVDLAVRAHAHAAGPARRVLPLRPLRRAAAFARDHEAGARRARDAGAHARRPRRAAQGIRAAAGRLRASRRRRAVRGDRAHLRRQGRRALRHQSAGHHLRRARRLPIGVRRQGRSRSLLDLER